MAEDEDGLDAVVYQLPTVVIWGDRIPVDPTKSGVSNTVITSEEIEERGYVSAKDVLKDVPGLEVSAAGGHGQLTTVFLRGAGSNQTAIYIDGIKVNSPGSGIFDLSNVPVENIESIQVIRGPQSSVGGSDAMGGSIHIVTKKGRGELNAILKTEVGPRKTLRTSLNLVGEKFGVDWSLTGAYDVSDGYSASSEHRQNEEQDGFRNRALIGRVGGDQFGRWDLTGRYTKSMIEIDGGADTENLLDFVTRDTLQASFSHLFEYSDKLRHRIRLGTSEERFEDMGLDGAFPFLTYYRTISGEAQIEAIHEWGMEAWGVQVLREEDRYDLMDHATTVGVFGEMHLNTPWDGRLIGGARVDNRRTQTEDLGNVATYRATLIQPISDSGFSVRGAYGTGFRHPNFFELLPPWGNPMLGPEASTTTDFGILFSSPDKKASVEATVFRTDYDNLISYVWPTGYLNVAKAQIKGAEISLSQRGSRVNRSISYTHLETLDLSTMIPLPRRPMDKVSGNISAAVGPGARPVWLSLAITGVFGRPASPFDLDEPDEYLTADMSVRYEVLNGLKVAIRVENVADLQHEQIPGYTTPRRAVYLTVTTDLQGLRKN